MESLAFRHLASSRSIDLPFDPFAGILLPLPLFAPRPLPTPFDSTFNPFLLPSPLRKTLDGER